MREFDRRAFLGAAVAASSLGVASLARAQEQPGLLTIVTGFAAGGNSDVICRSVAEGLRLTGFRSPAVVENRTGAAGQVSVTAMKTKPLDGSALLMTSSSVVAIYPHIYKSLQYDPVRDLLPVTLACKADIGIAVGPGVPGHVKSLVDFLDWARGQGGCHYGSAGSGTSPHLLAAVISKDAGAQLVHVPYRGSVLAIQDLLAGQIQAVAAPVGEFLAHLSSGRVRLLGVSGEERNPFAPEAPTLGELGYAKFKVSEWYGFFLAAGTPPAHVDRLQRDLARALQTPHVEKAFAAIGVRPISSSPRTLADWMAEDLKYWKRVVDTVGFTAES